MNFLAPLALSVLAAVPAQLTRVACVGDSITAGVGASSPSADYPSVLQAWLGTGTQVANFGHSGATLLSAGDLPYIQLPEYSATHEHPELFVDGVHPNDAGYRVVAREIFNALTE